MNLPNLMTISRLLIIPFIVIYFEFNLWQPNQIALILFIIAAFTDLLDGYLARAWDQKTMIGEILDPIADKALVVVTIILIVHRYQNTFLTLISIIIMLREIVVSGLRESTAVIFREKTLKVSILGKIKTVLQFFGIGFLLYYSYSQPLWILAFGTFLYLIAALMGVCSALGYFFQVKKLLVRLDTPS